MKTALPYFDEDATVCVLIPVFTHFQQKIWFHRKTARAASRKTGSILVCQVNNAFFQSPSSTHPLTLEEFSFKTNPKTYTFNIILRTKPRFRLFDVISDHSEMRKYPQVDMTSDKSLLRWHLDQKWKFSSRWMWWGQENWTDPRQKRILLDRYKLSCTDADMRAS